MMLPSSMLVRTSSLGCVCVCGGGGGVEGGRSRCVWGGGEKGVCVGGGGDYKMNARSYNQGF